MPPSRRSSVVSRCGRTIIPPDRTVVSTDPDGFPLDKRPFGCLTVLGVSAWHLFIGFLGIKRFSDGCFHGFHLRTRPGREIRPEERAPLRKSLQRILGIVKHGANIQAVRRLIERPEGFGIVSVQLEYLSEKSLGNLVRGEIH